MHGDGTGRIALPLPPRPLPTDTYVDPLVLDVTRSGPLTVVYYVGIGRLDSQNVLTLVDHGLFAVQVDDVGGVLTPDLPVRLSLPEITGVDPNSARHGSLSAGVDRLALVADSPNASILMTAKVERDSTLKIAGLSELTVVGDLLTIGVPDPNFPNALGMTGTVAYSPDGANIVASIYFDLWRIYLSTGKTELLTPNTDRFAEWNPSFSPNGNAVAFTRSQIRNDGSLSRDSDIYSLTLANGVVTAVTTNNNAGNAATVRNNAMWSSDNQWIGFSAYTSFRTPRNAPCSWLVNSEIFLIRADGSTTATQITNTNGSSVEVWPRWGW